MRRWPCVLLTLIGCGDDPPGEPGTRVVEVAVVPAAPVQQLDLLFQIDNTAGFDAQGNFAMAVRGLVAQLAVEGSLPDLHIGVITSDLGTSGSDAPANPAPPVGSCSGQGDDGMFVTSASVQGAFLIDNGAARNYDGELADVLSLMVQVGNEGCGFEQPLSATRRALQRPTGFLRSDAALAVVLLADEDDCSIADAALFDAANPQLGPLQSFRCTRHGVTCDESLDVLGEKTGCQPWRESPYVEDPQRTADFLRTMQPRDELLVVGAVVGAPSPFAVTERSIGGMTTLALAHSCQWTTPSGDEVADPAVRIASFVESFGSRGALTELCSADLGPQIARIGMAIKRALGTACIDTSVLADSSPAAGIQPACEVFDVVPSAGRPRELQTIAIPRCPADGDCHQLVADPVRCPETADHVRVDIVRAAPAAAGTRVEVRCEAPIER